MFRPIKNLAQLDYHMLLKNTEDIYRNNEVNAVFDKWNKKYGNNVNLNEDDDTNKNNLIAVANQVKADLNAIEPDDIKVINSLAVFLYEKPSTRKKKLFWYIYGEQLYNNLLSNVEHKNICRQCGCRTDEELVRGKCFKCRKEETKKGTKLIICVDCGKDFIVDPRSRTCRCDKCKNIKQLEWQRESMAKKRKCEVARETTNL